MKGYFRLSKTPRYSLLFALPLLLLYEALALALSHDALTGVRNGADVLLKSVFVWVGGRDGAIVFGVLLIGTGAVLVWRDMKRSGGKLEPKVFALMLLEAACYALLFGGVVAAMTGALLQGLHLLALNAPGAWDLPTQLMISLGAGIYEELLFRVIVVAGLAAAGRKLGMTPTWAGVMATIVGALIFSAFHYIGDYGEPWNLASFTFRAIAGVLFSGLYLLRGFGVTAWTHALYDVFLALRA